MKRTMMMASLCASALVLAVPALAQEQSKDEASQGQIQSFMSDYGIYASVGGGLNGFTQPTVAADTNLGGYWDARLGIGVKSFMGAELGYIGGTRNVTALGLNNSAFLYNNGLEGLVRLNAPLQAAKAPENLSVEPYAFGGLGWQHFALGGVTSNTSDVRSSDDIMTVPLGVGVGFNYGNATIDVRGTYHQALFSDMFGNTGSGFDPESLNNWGAGLSLGFVF